MAGKRLILFGRRFGESAEVDPNMWIVSYGDMMTHLMIFFLILYATTSIALSNIPKDALKGKEEESKEEQVFVKDPEGKKSVKEWLKLKAPTAKIEKFVRLQVGG